MIGTVVRVLASVVVLASASLLGVGSVEAAPAVVCTPTYFELEEPVAVAVGVSELSFRLLAIGCREELEGVWPPAAESLDREFQAALSEPHPVQILMLIRERSPELRKKLVARLNAIFERRLVHDVFLYDGRVAEH